MTGTRYTSLRCADAIVDAWLRGGGSQSAGARDTLRYLAFRNITEPASRNAMRREVSEQLSAGAGRTAAPALIVPASANWAANVWLRCAARVAAGLSTAAVPVVAARAWIVMEEPTEARPVPNPHLVVELTATSG